MLAIFFVRTEFPPNQHRCTAILAALQADEEAESDEAELKAAPSPSRSSDPDLDITETGDIALTTGSMEAEGV